MRYHNILLESLVTAYSYNRDETFLKNVLIEVQKRIRQIDCEHTDEGDIIYSALVIAYGEYGTSPRSGWISDPNLINAFINILELELAYLTQFD